MAKGKMTMTPQQYADKWSKRMKNSVTDIQTGIDGVTTSPMEKAIAKQDKMKQNLINAIDNGTWAAGLRGVSLDQWKSITKAKVANSLSAGVDAAGTKMVKFGTYLQTTVNNALSTISTMPDLTFDDSMNKVRAFCQAMQQNRYRK